MARPGPELVILKPATGRLLGASQLSRLAGAKGRTAPIAHPGRARQGPDDRRLRPLAFKFEEPEPIGRNCAQRRPPVVPDDACDPSRDYIAPPCNKLQVGPSPSRLLCHDYPQ